MRGMGGEQDAGGKQDGVGTTWYEGVPKSEEHDETVSEQDK